MTKLSIFLVLLSFLSISIAQNMPLTEEQLYKKMLSAYQNAQNIADKNRLFFNSEKYFDVIIYGEKLLETYPKTKYFSQVKNMMNKAFEIVLDVHKVVKYGIGSYYHFYCNTDGDYLAKYSVFDQFINKYPNSKFTPIFTKLKNNPSCIQIPDNKPLPDTIYFIVVQKFPSLNSLNEKKFEYLNKGFDFPHSFIVKNASMQYYILVYRFFSNRKKALTNLNKIKKDVPDAFILKGNVDAKMKNKNFVYPMN